MHTNDIDVEQGMARPTKDTVQITFRIPSDWLAEADELAVLLSRPGMPAVRTDALRAAIARGFQTLRSEMGSVPKKTKK